MTGIEIKNVSKHFKEVKALDDVSVSFGRNKIYGLLGRNGAGKTTLLNMISNRLYPDRGNVTLDGEPIPDNDAALGKIFMMGEVNLYPDSMKVKEALQWTVRFYPETDLEYAHAVAERFQLPLKKKIKSLSTGYASIFKLVTMLSTNAPFILMDEPVLGLDANHRDLFYRLLVEKYAERPATYI
ncbi:MAG TPA: ABC transporter ATP-binding protein, partial [Clostridiales bacterium]|nr:ABC transporter ATP-binding protein [Clostridiales bacterium]